MTSVEKHGHVRAHVTADTKALQLPPRGAPSSAVTAHTRPRPQPVARARCAHALAPIRARSAGSKLHEHPPSPVRSATPSRRHVSSSRRALGGVAGHQTRRAGVAAGRLRSAHGAARRRRGRGALRRRRDRLPRRAAAGHAAARGACARAARKSGPIAPRSAPEADAQRRRPLLHSGRTSLRARWSACRCSAPPTCSATSRCAPGRRC